MTAHIPFILSLKYRQEITSFCKSLSKIGLDYMVMYVVFNDGSRFVLSNIFHMLEAYYGESLYKEDYSFRSETIENIDYFLCDSTTAVSKKFKKMLEERFGVHRAYYIVRDCPECVFIFGAIKKEGFDYYDQIYKDTVRDFEDFCVSFTDEFLDLIIQYNFSYRHSFILTNPAYRKAVIKGGYPKNEELSEREKECLLLASGGKTTKEIAKILNISPYTVETHSKNIKEKMNCSSMIEAAMEGVLRGVIGSMHQWRRIDTSRMGNFKIISSMLEARQEIAKTNLELLNSA